MKIMLLYYTYNVINFNIIHNIKIIAYVIILINSDAISCPTANIYTISY